MKSCFMRMTNVTPDLTQAVPLRPRHSSDTPGAPCTHSDDTQDLS